MFTVDVKQQCNNKNKPFHQLILQINMPKLCDRKVHKAYIAKCKMKVIEDLHETPHTDLRYWNNIKTIGYIFRESKSFIFIFAPFY